MPETGPAPSPAVPLSRGGPLFRLLLRFHLAAPEAERLLRRAAFIALFAYLPVLVLALVEGYAVGSRVPMPLLRDPSAHVRLLLAIPLLVVAEPLADRVWAAALREFVSRGIVPPERRGALDEAVTRILRWRDSTWPELGLALLAYAGTWQALGRAAAPGDSWFVLHDAQAWSLTKAGAWYCGVAVPLLHFFTLRWLWHFFLWHVLLWRVSRMDLAYQVSHPDRAAGLSFLGRSFAAYAVVAFALSAVLCAVAGNRILHRSAAVLDFQVVIPVFAGILLVVLVAPVCAVFSPRIGAARRRRLDELGQMAADQGRRLVETGAAEGAAAAKPSSLLEIQSSITLTKATLPLPFQFGALVPLVLAVAAPALPLLFLVIPPGEVLKKLLHMFL